MSLSKASREISDTKAAPGSVVEKKEYHAHFDCFSGAAGDMLLAACLDASSDPDHLKTHVENCLAMGMPELANEFEIRTKKVWRGGMGSIAGMHVTVHSKYNHEPAPVPKRKMDSDDHSHNHEHRDQNSSSGEQDHSEIHSHDHQHHSGTMSADGKKFDDHNFDSTTNSHAHDHSHSHHHGHSHDHSSPPLSSGGPIRNLLAIKTLLEDADNEFIAPWVKSMAIATFTELAMAEATTHGADGIESVHFHEVGAVDSIVDTVGTLIALHYLGATSFSCSRIPIGEGSVWTAHGILPVPAPATLRLLVGMPTCPGPMGVVTGELVTPTGAALLRTLCLTTETSPGVGAGATPQKIQKLTGRPPSFTIRKIGIGAGTKDFEKHPNILRLLLGDNVVKR